MKDDENSVGGVRLANFVLRNEVLDSMRNVASGRSMFEG
jgi:hypothetical protein